MTHMRAMLTSDVCHFTSYHISHHMSRTGSAQKGTRPYTALNGVGEGFESEQKAKIAKIKNKTGKEIKKPIDLLQLVVE